MIEKRLLTVQEVCDYTGWGKTKTRQIIKNPDYHFTVRMGNRLYVDKYKFDLFLEQCMKYNLQIM